MFNNVFFIQGAVDLYGWAIFGTIVITWRLSVFPKGRFFPTIIRLLSSHCLEWGYNNLPQLSCTGQPIWSFIYSWYFDFLSILFRINYLWYLRIPRRILWCMGAHRARYIVLSCIWWGVGEFILTIPGYGSCRVLTGPDFQSVFNLQLWASNAKLINYYMLYGYVVQLYFYRWEF